MGRKKRKATEEPAAADNTAGPTDATSPKPPTTASAQSPAVIDADKDASATDATKASSGYAMTTHSAEIIDEDIYISDGSEDEEDAVEVELVLMGSRMGIMRRGIHHPMLVQPNRQWVREDAKAENADGGEGDEEAEQKRLKEQEEELAKLDPAQRAARLLAEKQKKLEEAKVTARRLESEENAGRDPCLFSKRTAFDIRFDQIDDKPWTRGAGDLTDFFNYGLTEEDWLEYSQQQLMIRQELTDATRQRRPPDPTLVPVTPRAPSKQTPKVAVAVSSSSAETPGAADDADATDAVIGPVLVKKEVDDDAQKSAGPDKAEEKLQDIHVGSGGAWGAGAAPGSLLAKLIEEQERKDDKPEQVDSSRGDDADSRYGPPQGGGGGHHNSHYQDSDHGGGGYGGGRNDWNAPEHSEHRGHYGHQGQHGGGWNSHGGHRGGRGGGGRGYYGGRGGRGGRGGYGGSEYGGRGRDRDRSYQDGGGSYRGGGGHRKRPREEYDNRRRY